jgi:hypothetical protein
MAVSAGRVVNESVKLLGWDDVNFRDHSMVSDSAQKRNEN